MEFKRPRRTEASAANRKGPGGDRGGPPGGPRGARGGRFLARGGQGGPKGRCRRAREATGRPKGPQEDEFRVESELVRASPAGMRGAADMHDNADAYMPTCLICLICPTELLI